MLTRILSSRLVIGASLVWLLSSCSQQKTGYVDIFKLVKEFELQQEYSADAKREMDREKAAIDSVIYIEQQKNPTGYESVKEELYATYYRRTDEINKRIESMIWKRLNPYLEEFGKDKGYTFIYGANGTGNVLYADKSKDITDEVIDYVNKRYHDKK